jgi:P-type Ca2+ transporter type 2C
MGACTLGVIWWGDDHRTIGIARTMGLTTFAIANLFFSLTCRDELRSIFSLDFLEDRKLVIASGLSVVAICSGPS